jgi:hypothetical protein
MLKPKTHFEQVPLETVKKIVEEQIRRETTIERSQGNDKNALHNLTDAVPELPILRV